MQQVGAASTPRRRCARSWLLLKFGWLITGGSTALPRNAGSEIDLFFEIRWVQQLRISAAARGRASMLPRGGLGLRAGGLAGLASVHSFLQLSRSVRVSLKLVCVRARRFGHLRLGSRMRAFIDALVKTLSTRLSHSRFTTERCCSAPFAGRNDCCETRLNQS